MIPRDRFDELVYKCKSDRHYKTFFAWDQLVTMLFGIFSRCDSSTITLFSDIMKGVGRNPKGDGKKIRWK